MNITEFNVQPLSMIPKETPYLQRVAFSCVSDSTGHIFLSVFRGGKSIVEKSGAAVQSGHSQWDLFLPFPEKAEATCWKLFHASGELLAEYQSVWEPPRRWTFYVVASTHTDIGLHNSQYIQRYNCSRFLKKAMELVDQTEGRPEESRYRYVMEGTWFWNNYGADHGRSAAESVVEKYIRTGKISVGAGLAGNHTQTYGMEEMCRSACQREALRREWNISSETMTMIDNNGMSWALVGPYCSAGYKNILFAPNQWNPLPSTVWKFDTSVPHFQWNPAASGGGSRVDVRYDSDLPMVFYWQGADEKSRLLTWCSTQYAWGGSLFGLYPDMRCSPDEKQIAENRMAKMLPFLEEKYPFDLWMLACYSDDQEPSLFLSDFIADWNLRWSFPQLRMTGNLDEPFRLLRERFDAQIPVLRGDITGGWYQHPLSTPELLAEKFQADRLLPTAEKLAVIAGLSNPDYEYPAVEFQRAWYALFCNDEHSYGTSGYQGRRVYETWMQHRDWIAKARMTAERESRKALEALAEKVDVREDSLLVFNPEMFPRRELIATENGRFLTPEIPSLGYRLIPQSEWKPEICRRSKSDSPVEIENRFYRVKFSENGSIANVYDKELKCFLFDEKNCFHGNEFIYTNDNHKTCIRPEKARFETEKSETGIQVRSVSSVPAAGAEVIQTVFLPEHEKRIDIDNQLLHVRDLINANRYYRYGYYAFPFAVENAGRLVQLNGCIASPRKDQTGHGTDVYLAGREWSCVENGRFGVALLQLDSQLVEFGRIHPDKTDFGAKEDGSAIFSALFNDWLQMHTPGGSHVNPRFRYSIISYAGDCRKANIPRAAERVANPLLSLAVKPHKGELPPAKSFGTCINPNLRLLALKRAEDGRGVILRLHETFGETLTEPDFNFPSGGCPERNTVDERPLSPEASGVSPFDYLTCRFELPRSLKERPLKPEISGDAPAPVGSVYTGLIDEPVAACGADRGQLYLIWGQNMEPGLSRYELHRSETGGFIPAEENFIAYVEPGVYRVGLYEDTGLKDHTVYYYRVRAVNGQGKCSPWSREFHGITKEMQA